MDHSEEHYARDQELSWVEPLPCCTQECTEHPPSNPVDTFPAVLPGTWSPEDKLCATTALGVEEITILLGGVSKRSKLETPKLDE